MNITMEKIVFIAITLAVVAVVGFYLLDVSISQSGTVSQKVYARLVSSEFVKNCGTPVTGSCYKITIRIVNPSEKGMSLYMNQDSLMLIKFFGFDPRDLPPDIFSWLNDFIKVKGFSTPYIVDAEPIGVCCCQEIPPKDSWEFTIVVDSDYIQGEKSVILTPLMEEPGLWDPCWDHDPCDPSGLASISIPVP